MDERRRHEPEGADGPDGEPRGVGTMPAQVTVPATNTVDTVTAAPARVVAWLTGADFPATPYDLMRHAEGMGAPDEVVTILRTLPARRYLTMPEVSRAVRRGSTRRRW